MDRSQCWIDFKEIFKKWEKLRLVYNLILLIVFVIVVAGKNKVLWDVGLITGWIFDAIGANICFFAAPITESYAYWLGVRGRWITATLFVCGVLISIPLVILFVLASTGLQ
ncbi:MAG: hypothetical protein SD837_03380 [Candidatus Electrothrix scaldis]|nr:MAG: hypothetical protein SD837_03380 [Candidatus Electrothrix sp. GW3-3]